MCPGLMLTSESLITKPAFKPLKLVS